MIEPRLGAGLHRRISQIAAAVAQPRPDVDSGIGDVTLDDPRVDAVSVQPRRHPLAPVLAVDVQPRREHRGRPARCEMVRGSEIISSLAPSRSQTESR